MEIYIKYFENDVIEVNDVYFDSYSEIVEVKNIYEFLDKVKNNLSSELEAKLLKLLTAEDIIEEQISTPKFNIKHWVSNRSFGEIIDMYLSGEIMKPNMQREFVWDSIKCSRLIESIIMGLPIPPFFLLEVEKNKYEIIDGFQRITTLVNYVNGLPWNFNINEFVDEKDEINIDEVRLGVSLRPSKLSKLVFSEISNRSFSKLDPEYQRIIKRSTIPLIEFNQVSPDNFESKYLIFERINTGSEKLNAMQIRKSLAFGSFMENLYEESNNVEKFMDLFSTNSLKKDYHVEAYLRTYVMSKILKNEFIPQKAGIKNILNEFCEKNRNLTIDEDYKTHFEEALNEIYEAFNNEHKWLFKRTDIFNKGAELADRFVGNINIGILEAFIGNIIIKKERDITYIKRDILQANYLEQMDKLGEDTLLEERYNPFTSNTGSLDAIKQRFEILNNILGV